MAVRSKHTDVYVVRIGKCRLVASDRDGNRNYRAFTLCSLSS